MRSAIGISMIAFVLVAACGRSTPRGRGGSSEVRDGGVVPRDAAGADGSARDGSSRDGSSRDASVRDAAARDATSPDARPRPDATPPPPPPPPPPDAGVFPDAAVPDSGCVPGSVGTIFGAVPHHAESSLGPPEERVWQDVNQALIMDANDLEPIIHASFISALVNLERSRRLIVTDFRLDIPANAEITGISFEVRRRAFSGVGIRDNAVQLVRSGVVVGSNYAWSDTWPALYGIATYGGPSDTWGEMWTAGEVADPSFGIAIQAFYNSISGNDWPLIDSVRANVTFRCN